MNKKIEFLKIRKKNYTHIRNLNIFVSSFLGGAAGYGGYHAVTQYNSEQFSVFIMLSSTCCIGAVVVGYVAHKGNIEVKRIKEEIKEEERIEIERQSATHEIQKILNRNILSLINK